MEREFTNDFGSCGSLPEWTDKKQKTKRKMYGADPQKDPWKEWTWKVPLEFPIKPTRGKYSLALVGLGNNG